MPNLTHFSPKVEKRSSPIDGRGLFATTALAKDEIVVVKGGYVFTREQRDQIGQDLGPSEIQITETLFIGPATLAEREGGMMHLNTHASRIWDCRARSFSSRCETSPLVKN